MNRRKLDTFVRSCAAAAVVILFAVGASVVAVYGGRPSTEPDGVAARTASARSPSTQTGGNILAYAGSSRTQLQNALNLAGRNGVPLNIAAGTYNVDRPLVVPPGLHLDGNSVATLIGTAPGPILMVSGDGTRVEGLALQGSVDGVTGVSGEFIRASVRDCNFWTSLTNGVDGHGLLSRITDCRFGVSGDWPKASQPIRIRSADGSTNAWAVRDCAIYHAAGDCAIEFGDGYQLEISGCNIEQNNTRVAVKLAGMFTAHIHDNWFENNAGESQVELIHDATDRIGNYVVNSHDNFWKLNGKGNKRAYLTYGACGVNFHDEVGANWTGMAIASDMGKVDVGRCWLVGQTPSAPPVVQHP